MASLFPNRLCVASFVALSCFLLLSHCPTPAYGQDYSRSRVSGLRKSAFTLPSSDDKLETIGRKLQSQEFGVELQMPPKLNATGGKLELDLFLGYREVTFNNGESPVRLRTYSYRQGNEPIEFAHLTGPTLSIHPNDELIINLHNRLPLNGAELLCQITLDTKDIAILDSNIPSDNKKLPNTIVTSLATLAGKDGDIVRFDGRKVLPDCFEVTVARRSFEWFITCSCAADEKGRKAGWDAIAYKKLQLIRKEQPNDDDLLCTVYGIDTLVDVKDVIPMDDNKDAVPRIIDIDYIRRGTLNQAGFDWLEAGSMPQQLTNDLIETAKSCEYGTVELFPPRFGISQRLLPTKGESGNVFDIEAVENRRITRLDEEKEKKLGVYRMYEAKWVSGRQFAPIEPVYDRALRIVIRTNTVPYTYEVYGVSSIVTPGHDHNEPHDFNQTNLHVHGLHVSPQQDDVFRSVPPSLFSRYHYTLSDPDSKKMHTSGTYWYHPHLHGSTAIQVSSGASGMLIVEDDAKDDEKDANLEIRAATAREKIMIFNEIIFNPDQRSWRSKAGKLEAYSVGCAERYVGLLDSFNAHPRDGVTINGQIKPQITMRPGEVQRWRLLQSGYHSALAFELVKKTGGEKRAYDNLTKDRIRFCQFAVDGINFRRPRMIDGIYLAPGNRTDVLVKVPDDAKDGDKYNLRVLEYQGIGEYFPENTKPKMPEYENKLGYEGILGTVVIKGDPMKPSMSLPRIDRDLPEHRHGWERLDRHHVANTRTTIFNLIRGQFQVDGGLFNSEIISHEPVAGSIEKWNVHSQFNIHPFHIHCNPFQVMEYLEFYGEMDFDKGEPKKGDEDKYHIYRLDPPMWKDTAMVMGPVGNNQNNRVQLLTCYDQRFTGDFVMHCHILFHEDKGMMQRIRVVDPPRDKK